MRLRLPADLRLEPLDAEVLACVPDRGVVHRLSGPTAEGVRALTDGPADVPDEVAATLVSLGVAVADEPVDAGRLTRRRMLLLSGAATIGVSTLVLPHAAAAASTIGGGGGTGPTGPLGPVGPEGPVATTSTTTSTTTTTTAPTTTTSTTTTTAAPTTTTTTAPPGLNNGGTVRGTGTFNDPNGITIVRGPTAAALTMGANWDTATLSGPRSDVLAKNGPATVGALTRDSNRNIVVNLPVGTTYTLTIVWSGNSRPTSVYVFTA